MKQWGERLQGKDFHGGDAPDESDFLVMHFGYNIK